MNKTRELIEKKITNAGSGYVFTRKDFQDIASSGSVGQILSRMVKDGVIRQIGRGVFDLPNTNPALGGQLSPDINQAAKAIARKFRWSIFALRKPGRKPFRPVTTNTCQTYLLV